MDYDRHCQETVFLYGLPFEEVHRWLDEFEAVPSSGIPHRAHRHHLAGIEEVRKEWGDLAALAALRHIMSDLVEQGWKDGDPIPRDADEYIRMGFI